MKFINELTEGANVVGIYLCKQKNTATTKNGKEYENLTLTDKTGSINAKIWEPNSMGIGDFDVNDYIEVHAKVTSFNGALQMSLDRAFKASEGSYNPEDYLPVSSKDTSTMYKELLGFVNSVQAPYYRLLLESIFVDDENLKGIFIKHSAAKSIHHGFVGGLLEHTLSVCKLCDFYCTQYPVLNRDLLITAALCHDIGKTKELSSFPLNDYTDAGQLLGHIIIGIEIVGEKINNIKGFPAIKADELKHCIAAHHGEYEFGSPKKPAIVEAVALNFADNTDAKIEAMTELFNNVKADDSSSWLGYQRTFDSNIRTTD